VDTREYAGVCDDAPEAYENNPSRCDRHHTSATIRTMAAFTHATLASRFREALSATHVVRPQT
jgi:hypothetical protein